MEAFRKERLCRGKISKKSFVKARKRLFNCTWHETAL
jgi:hypothetical protein